jgi:hypothetical protein
MRPRPFTSKCPQIVKFKSHYAIHSSLSSPEAPASSITMPTSHTHLLYLNITQISHELLKPRWKFQLPTKQVGTYSLTMSTIEIASRFGRTSTVTNRAPKNLHSFLSMLNVEFEIHSLRTYCALWLYRRAIYHSHVTWGHPIVGMTRVRWTTCYLSK